MAPGLLSVPARFPKRLFVLAQTPHWTGPDGTLWAYEPYVREMRVWADLFARVEICYPPGEGPLRGNLAPYHRENLDWLPVPYSLVTTRSGPLRRLSRLHRLALRACAGVRRADLVLLRSPAHFGLIGAGLVRAMRRPSVTKWAGENAAFAGERIPSRVERLFQGIPNERHPVLVYGPARRAHQVSFLPALMTAEELERARRIAADRVWRPPWRILGVGRLTPAKGFDLALTGLGELRRERPDLLWTCTLVGEGESGQELRRLAAACGIADRVTFTGALPFQDVQSLYGEAHVAVMPGTKEGWPKVIAEAWAHGAIPVAAAAGLVPWILRDRDSGVVFEPSPAALGAALARLLSDPAGMKSLSESLPGRAQELSLERFQERLEGVLIERFGYE